QRRIGAVEQKEWHERSKRTDCQEALELLPSPSGRRSELSGLHRTAHVSLVSKDGGRTCRPHWRAAVHSSRLSMDGPLQPGDGRRQAGTTLPRLTQEAR